MKGEMFAIANIDTEKNLVQCIWIIMYNDNNKRLSARGLFY